MHFRRIISRIKYLEEKPYLYVIELKNSSDQRKSPASTSGRTPLLKRSSWLNMEENVAWNCCLNNEIAGMMSCITS